MDYFYADVTDGICYNFDEGEPCIILFAFCHPLPLDLSENCRNPESAICQADKLADATKSWSMGAFENYTRFYESKTVAHASIRKLNFSLLLRC